MVAKKDKGDNKGLPDTIFLNCDSALERLLRMQVQQNKEEFDFGGSDEEDQDLQNFIRAEEKEGEAEK